MSYVCPNCGKMQEYNVPGVTIFMCQFCGTQIKTVEFPREQNQIEKKESE
jgi:ribosomal protein L37AE/L43A